jgi:hypothetical protein
MLRAMKEDTKPRTNVLTWIGFAASAVLAIGWALDRTTLASEVAKARAQQSAARAELAEISAARPEAPPALPQLQLEPAPDTQGAANPSELETVRSELSSARTELTATKQALSDADDTRAEVGRKLAACHEALNQLQASR